MKSAPICATVAGFDDEMHGAALFAVTRRGQMQLRVLWEEIMKRFHTIEVVGEVKRNPNNCIRGIAELPVRIRPL
jgi:hypothetical protein